MTKYSNITGIWKSIKNVAVVMGIPALVLLLDNYTQWLPNEYNQIAAPIIGLVAYFIKNRLQVKGKLI